MNACKPGWRALLPWAAAGALIATPSFADVDAPYAWEVTGPKAHHFLIGSTRVLVGPDAALPDGLQDIYADAESLWFETDIGALDLPEVQSGLMAAARSPGKLKSEIGAGLYAKLRPYLQRLRVRADACDGYRPWFCALTLDTLNYRRAGFGANDGLDEILFAAARDDGKSLRWLEPPADHLKLFTDMSEALSKNLLQSTLHDGADIWTAEPRVLLGAWRKNDFTAVERRTAEFRRDYPQLYERLFAARHGRWMPKLIQALERSEPQLIVVDAAHLAGAEGLIALLRARGYKVQPYITLPEPQLETRLAPSQQAVSFRTPQ